MKRCIHPETATALGCSECLVQVIDRSHRIIEQRDAYKEAAELAEGRVKCTCDDGYHDRCPLMQFEAAMENARTMGES